MALCHRHQTVKDWNEPPMSRLHAVAIPKIARHCSRRRKIGVHLNCPIFEPYNEDVWRQPPPRAPRARNLVVARPHNTKGPQRRASVSLWFCDGCVSGSFCAPSSFALRFTFFPARPMASCYGSQRFNRRENEHGRQSSIQAGNDGSA
jgi:hypothetical protein